MKNITKKHKEQLKNLVNEKGYWSDNVSCFINQWSCQTKKYKLHYIAMGYEKEALKC